MNLKELRILAKKYGVKSYSTMKRAELLKKVNEFEKEVKLKEETKCLACLNEQRNQLKIDEKTYNQRLLDNMVRELACQYCKHERFIYDGEFTFCESCGAAQDPPVAYGRC